MITKGLNMLLQLPARLFGVRAPSVSGGILGIVAVAALSVGCGVLGEQASNVSDPTSVSGSPTEQASAEPTPAAGPCVNPYYPIEPRARKVYKTTASSAGNNTKITLEQRAPEGDTFTEIRTLDSGLTITTPWTCEDGALRMVEYQNLIQSNKMNFTMETVESSGVTVPASWKVGDEWESNYKIKVNLKAGPINTNAGGTVSIKDKLVSESEPVKVEGGEFDAAKVESVIKIVVSYGGRQVPSADVKVTRWHSPKIGIVKQESSGPFGTETTEYAGEAQ